MDEAIKLLLVNAPNLAGVIVLALVMRRDADRCHDEFMAMVQQNQNRLDNLESKLQMTQETTAQPVKMDPP